MKKFAYSTILSLSALALGTVPALAQTYVYPNGYVNTGYSNYNTGNCGIFTVYQALGSSDATTGGQVTQLQQFLNQTGYLSGISGYFDTGTYGAVINFQRAHGIAATGTVGPLTRQAIQQQGCNGSSYGYTNGSYPYSNYGYATPTISSLSTSYGQSGTTVTIYGSNLSNGNTTVYLGNTPVSASSNNNITFTVPYIAAGTYQLYVANGNGGSSNQLSFTVTGNNGNNSNCYYTNNTYQCGCNNGYTTNYNYNNYSNGYYNSNTNCNNQSVYLSSLSSTNVSAGQTVTIYGNGFTSNGNSVYFNGTTISNVYSSNGTSLSFVVPSNNYYSGSYSVSVTNGNGVRSNSLSLTVNSYNYNNGNCYNGYYSTTNCYNNNYNYTNGNSTWYGGNGQPSVSSVQGPTYVNQGSNNTWSVSAYDQNNTAMTVRVDWGDNTSTNQNTQSYSYGSNQQYSFSHSYYNSGSYTIRFTATDANGAYSYSTLPIIVR